MQINFLSLIWNTATEKGIFPTSIFFSPAFALLSKIPGPRIFCTLLLSILPLPPPLVSLDTCQRASTVLTFIDFCLLILPRPAAAHSLPAS